MATPTGHESNVPATTCASGSGTPRQNHRQCLYRRRCHHQQHKLRPRPRPRLEKPRRLPRPRPRPKPRWAAPAPAPATATATQLQLVPAPEAPGPAHPATCRTHCAFRRLQRRCQPGSGSLLRIFVPLNFNACAGVICLAVQLCA